MKKDMKKKKIIIIGAGCSGLSAGIYGQKFGYDTEIYEKNPNNGGLCVSWVRKDTLIDGCIHWMTGTKEGTDLNKLWKQLNAFDSEDIIYSDNFGSFEHEGKIFTFWCDLKKFEQECLEISPEDKRMIRKTVKLIEKIYYMPIPVKRPLAATGLFSYIKIGFKLLPYLPSFIYSSKTSCAKYARKFKSPFLRFILTKIVPGDENLYGTLYAYGTAAFCNGGVPRGGSKYLIQRMENEYKNCGGIIHNNAEIDEILIEKKKVVGLKLKNGEVVKGDYYITCCDAYEATRHLLRKNYYDAHLLKRFKRMQQYPTPSCVYVSFKADSEALSKLNITSTFEFECEPIQVGTKIEKSIKMRDYSYDKSLINKDGKVLLNILIHQNDKDYYYWENLRKDYKKYYEQKNKIAEEVKLRIIKRFPSLEGQLETIDVCTPMTYKRYVNAYRGGYMSWAFTQNGRQLIHKMTYRNIKNLILSGQWVIMPGGLPPAMLSGKFAIQLCCKKDHRNTVLKEDKLCYQNHKLLKS